MNKKRNIFFLAITITLIVVIALVTISILSISNNRNDINIPADSKDQEIELLVSNAKKAANNNDTEAAKNIYLQLRKIYVNNDDTNNIIMTDILIDQLSQKNTPSETADSIERSSSQ
jgi:hypothetical protein